MIVEMLTRYCDFFRLDDINSTLKQSERHLTGIKSVFGGIRNYFSGRSQTSGVPPQSQPGGPRMPSAGGEGIK